MTATVALDEPAYDLRRVVPTVVHLGLGAFHRAHQAAYADAVLATGSATGGICAGSLHSSTTHDALSRQEHVYVLLERDSASGDRPRLIGSIRQTVPASPDGAEALLGALTRPEVTVVTLTVTEKGYCAVGASRELDVGRPEVAHDIARPHAPRSVPGVLVEALARRRAAGSPPLTISSCDNIPDNGSATRRVVTELAEHRGGDLAEWIRGRVAFPSSMVDRIVPAPTAALRQRVADLTGRQDACPVAAEPFTQWVLEDTFPTGRPPWQRVGVQLVTRVEPHERAKVRLLNGAHTAVAYLGLLRGHHDIADAVRDPLVRRVVQQMLAEEVVPTLEAVPGTDLGSYVEDVLRRFENDALGYTTVQVGSDGSEKLPPRILGTVRDGLATGAATTRLSLVVAAFAACSLGPGADQWSLSDPTLSRLLDGWRGGRADPGATVDRLLDVREIFGVDLAAHPRFRAEVLGHARKLWRGDVAAVLDGIRDRSPGRTVA